MAAPAIRRLLCATDLSPASRAAWEEARLLGALFGAEIVLLHVVPPLPFGAEHLPPPLLGGLRETSHRAAHEGLDRLLDAGSDAGLKVSVRVEQGPAARRILEVAREEAPDILVVGTGGPDGPGRPGLGAVADRVVRLSPCPVLAVPGVPAPRAARIARVLHPTDFSPVALAAWPWTLLLAEAAGAEVDLLHVTPLPAPDRELPAEAVGRMAGLLHAEAEAEAERLLRGCPLPRPRVRVLVERGTPHERILHWARARDADLVVMGTHGRSGVLAWTLGSVTHHVMQAAPLPVLAVGPGSPAEERPHVA